MPTDRTADLRTLLQRARLSPEQLARGLTQSAAELGLPGRIDPKTPYKWLHGTHPRRPWQVLTVQLLNTVLGSELTPADFGWQDDSRGILVVPADTGLSL